MRQGLPSTQTGLQLLAEELRAAPRERQVGLELQRPGASQHRQLVLGAAGRVSRAPTMTDDGDCQGIQQVLEQQVCFLLWGH